MLPSNEIKLVADGFGVADTGEGDPEGGVQGFIPALQHPQTSIEIEAMAWAAATRS